MGRAAEDLCRAGASSPRRIETRLTGSTVGVTRIDGDHAHSPAGRFQILLVDDERRRADAIAGECRRRTGRPIRHNQRKVGTAAGLETSFDSSKTEAPGNNRL